MNAIQEINQKTFQITYYGLTLPFKLFTKQYILDRLKLLKDSKIISSYMCITIEEKKKPFEELEEHYGKNKEKLPYYFAYIKLFKIKENNEEKIYGLVGGKSNYNGPDINFETDTSKKDCNTVARNFLKSNGYEWDRNIIIVNFEKKENSEKNIEDKQVMYLEDFLQREFNLLKS